MELLWDINEVTKMKQCKVCNKTEYNHQFDRTTDGHNVCLGCMSEAQDYYKKGLLSLEQINNYYEILKNYKNKLIEMVLHCRKQGKHNNENPINILKEVIELERSLALTSYNKGRGFHKINIDLTKEDFLGETMLTITEHYFLTQQILDNFDLIRPKMTTITTIKQSDSNGSYNQFVKKHYSRRYTSILV